MPTGIIYTIEEKNKLVEEYKAGQKGLQEFALENGVSVATFKKWLVASTDITFGTIKLENLETQRVSLTFVGKNIRLEVEENINQTFLKKLVEVIIND